MPIASTNWDAVRDDAVATMSRYIQFDTTNPPGQEMAAAQWLADQLRRRLMIREIAVHEPAPGRGLVLARIPGTEPLRPLLINHHIDVVAADPTQWTHLPFSGAVADGYVWGRGTLDTKSLGIFYLLALEQLCQEGVHLRRPVVFLAVPDEEAGGEAGMHWLVEHYGQTLNPEWVWDEGSGGIKGMFGDQIQFGVCVAEKQICHIKLSAAGRPGHASMPHDDNCNVRLLAALQRVLAAPRPLHVNATVAAMFRSLADTQKFPASALLARADNPLVQRLLDGRLSADPMLNALVRDTISLTVLKAGYKVNVIPERAEAEIDCRLLPETDREEFLAWLRARIADERVLVEVSESSPPSGVAPFDSAFYTAVQHAVTRHVPGAGVFPMLTPGATDGRYWRSQGFAAYGFSPMIMAPGDLARMHGIDERISIENLLLGVKIARDIIAELCV
jgi:acetylornithine deacetylase/succinyl-diaminopimelate desuccinylase-like protein